MADGEARDAGERNFYRDRRIVRILVGQQGTKPHIRLQIQFMVQHRCAQITVYQQHPFATLRTDNRQVGAKRLLPSPEMELVTRITWPRGPPLLPCMSEVQSTRIASVYEALGAAAETVALEEISVGAGESRGEAKAEASTGALAPARRFR